MGNVATARRPDVIDELRAEIDGLRRELVTLRDSLAVEIRTRRIIVANGQRLTEIIPGEVLVEDERNGCRGVLCAEADHAEVDVCACDVVPMVGPIQHVSLIAWSDYDCEPGGPYAEVTVNSVELPVPAAASPSP